MRIAVIAWITNPIDASDICSGWNVAVCGGFNLVYFWDTMSLQDEIDKATEAAAKEVKARYMKANRQREEWRRQMRRVVLWLILFAILFVVAYLQNGG